jgi:nitrate reductase alpha subunit
MTDEGRSVRADASAPDPPASRLAPLLPGGEPVESLLRSAQFLTPGEPSADYREVRRRGGRAAKSSRTTKP